MTDTANQANAQDDEFQTVEGTFAKAWIWIPDQENPIADGKVFVGTYVAMDPNGKGKKPGEKFNVFHFFDPEGARRSMFGADLDSKLSRVPFGTKVRVTYVKEERLSNGNTMRVFSVEASKTAKLIEPMMTRNA